MFELRDLPDYQTAKDISIAYGNKDVDGLYTWLSWAGATTEMLAAFEANLMQAGGLSQAQFFVLMLLKRNPQGLSVGALAHGAGVASQTMTRTIDRMEKAQLCQRHTDPSDRRAWILTLSPEGEALLAKVLPEHYKWTTQLMTVFNQQERATLKQLMDKLKASGLLPKTSA